MHTDDLISAADEYLQECFRAESPPRATEFASMLNLPRWQLAKRFRRVAGVTLHEYFRSAQMLRAEHLLTTTELPMNAIAYASGFGTRATFYRAFKATYDATPERIRGRARTK